jgi:hypothetical protein
MARPEPYEADVIIVGAVLVGLAAARSSGSGPTPARLTRGQAAT